MRVRQILRTGSFIGDKLMLDYFIGYSAHAGFAYTELRQFLGFVSGKLTYFGNYLLSLSYRVRTILLVCF